MHRHNLFDISTDAWCIDATRKAVYKATDTDNRKVVYELNESTNDANQSSDEHASLSALFHEASTRKRSQS
jgi:uncharacterized phage-associated protein